MITTPDGEGDRILDSFRCDVLHVGDNGRLNTASGFGVHGSPRFYQGLTRPQTTRTRDVARSPAMHASEPDQGSDQWL